MTWLSLLGLLSLQAPPADRLGRSYWLHASLGDLTQRGYWGPDFPATPPPTGDEVRRAAALLTGPYAANRLYLVYHHELPLDQARTLFLTWREALPREVEVVPTLVLRMYDQAATPVFTTEELAGLAAFLRDGLHAERVGYYDVYPRRDQGPGLDLLRQAFPGRVVRVGSQPGEALGDGIEAAVQDTWGGVCDQKANADWLRTGAGVLGGWVRERNGGPPVAWDLITVAWDYSASEQGAYPGYDDARRNQPLPAGRNVLAAKAILESAEGAALAGFSSDLCILQANSFVRDGREGGFYRALRRGEQYAGYFHEPLDEVADIFAGLREGNLPE
ncbi:MAG: hypothetical protein HYU66_07740 [Armatimonadetes bacterium]|nr:hypothetical protein [Armatimonadota bacterium]